MNIVEATLQHLDDLVPLFDKYRIFYKATSDCDSARRYLSDRMSKGESTIFIAYIDSVAVGFTQIYPMWSSVSMLPILVLNDLYVDALYRKQKIGESLLIHAQAYAKKSLAKSLILETDIDNPAQYLYEKLGWVKDSQHLHYYWSTK